MIQMGRYSLKFDRTPHYFYDEKYGRDLTNDEVLMLLPFGDASTPSAEVHGKALDAAIETFKEERERWATEKRSLERRLKEALNHTGGK